MVDPKAKDATLAVILERFNSHRLPRVLALRTLVNQGERLGEFDLRYLERVIRDVHHFQALAKDNERYRQLLGRAISLYTEVVAQALENERQANIR